MTDAEMKARDEEIFAAHLGGAPYSTISEQFGITRARAQEVFTEKAREKVTQIEIDLMVAEKLESMGVEAEWPTYLVPFQEQSTWQPALDYFQWTLSRLRKRGVPVRVTTRQTTEGTVFQLTTGDQKDNA